VRSTVQGVRPSEGNAVGVDLARRHNARKTPITQQRFVAATIPTSSFASSASREPDRNACRPPCRRPGLSALPLAATVVWLAGAAPVHAQAPADTTDPSRVFVQFGLAKGKTRALTLGWTRDWAWRRQFAAGTFGGYWEVALGRWTTGTGDDRATAWVTQVGITPVLRWFPGDGSGNWFVEGGIGLHVLAPIYRKPDKRFSTALNFGDHLAVGRSFGEGRRDELALRFQHFSNGGFRKPNPGENFVQLRYSRRF
jgi:lipid A 3-O-deacylase